MIIIDAVQRVWGRELPLRALGYTTVMDLMADLSDVVRWERPDHGDWLLFDASLPRHSMLSNS